MAGIDMIQMSRSTPPDKGEPKKNGRQDEGVTGFRDLLKEKEGLKDGKDMKKGPVSPEETVSEKTDPKNTAQDHEEGILREEELTEAQLNALLAGVLMKLQPQMPLKPPVQGKEEGESGEKPSLPGISGRMEEAFAGKGGNLWPAARTDQAGERQAGAALEGVTAPSEDVSAPMEPVSREGAEKPPMEHGKAEVLETVFTRQGHGQVLAGIREELGEPRGLARREPVLPVKEEESEAGKTMYHEEGVMIQNRPMSQTAPAPQPRPVEILRTSQDTLPQDVGHMLGARLPASQGTLVVELEPASLGKLTIQMVYEEGKAAVSILASNPKTLELLNRNLSDIAYILEQKTGQETVIYTQNTEQQAFYDPQQDKERQKGQDRRQEKKEEPSDSFAQQLRLGLV